MYIKGIKMPNKREENANITFNNKLAKMLGVKEITGLDKFSLFGGVIGLIADTIGILTFASGLVVK